MTICCISFHPCRSIRYHHLNSLVVLEYPILYTKFQGHRPLGSEEDVWRFLPYMGLEVILVIPTSHGGSIWNLVSNDLVFCYEKKNRSRSTQDHHLGKLGSTRVPDAVYQISTISANRFRRKRFLRFLPYLGVAAIVTDWPSSFWRDDVWRVWTTDNACLSYKLTDEPSAFTRYNKLYPTWCMKLSVSQSSQG